MNGTLIAKLKDWWWLAVTLIALAGFIYTLPKRLDSVEAGVKKADESNVEQYRILDRLTYIAEQNQQIQKQQQQAPHSLSVPNQYVPPRQEWQDQDGTWWCCEEGCQMDENWYGCN